MRCLGSDDSAGVSFPFGPLWPETVGNGRAFAALRLTRANARVKGSFNENYAMCRVPARNQRIRDMAKPTTIKIRLNSTAGTGHFYVTKKNARTMTEKMVIKKYDPVVRKHVEYKEGKIK